MKLRVMKIETPESRYIEVVTVRAEGENGGVFGEFEVPAPILLVALDYRPIKAGDRIEMTLSAVG